MCLTATFSTLYPSESALLAEGQIAVSLWNIHRPSSTGPAALVSNINTSVIEEEGAGAFWKPGCNYISKEPQPV